MAPKKKTRTKHNATTCANDITINEDRNKVDELQLREWKEKIKLIKKWDKDLTFYRPVTEDIAPNYFNEIEKPMDLYTIENKLKTKQYTHEFDLLEDLHLICKNAWKYNPDGSDVHTLAKELWTKIVEAFNTNINNDDDGNLISQSQVDLGNKALTAIIDTSSRVNENKHNIVMFALFVEK